MPLTLQCRDKRSMKVGRSTQGKAIGEGEEGEAFADWGCLLVFKIVVQMLRPYGME